MSFLRLLNKSSARLFIFASLLFFSALYILHSQIQLQENRVDGNYLQGKLDELVKEYKRVTRTQLGSGHRQTSSDLAQITVILLENISKRVQLLEQKQQKLAADYNKLSIQNGLSSLNHSIHQILSSHDQEICTIPNDPLYPECEGKVEWLRWNWKKDIKFSQKGVDGSLCTILKYFQEVEPFCPTKIKKNQCEIPNHPKFPKCHESVLWMINNWKNDKHYSNFGIDGTLCSILFYLSEVESKCPPRNKTSSKFKNDCVVPDDKSYPDCQTKVDWMKVFWKSHRCYSEDFGIDGSLCSFLYYLSYEESFCPKHSNWSISPSDTQANISAPIVNIEKTSKEELLKKLGESISLFKWIRSRISRMYNDWYNSVLSLKNRVNISGNAQKKILVHIGVLSEESSLHFAETADKGGPLGELVQWSDLISSLYILGHDIRITANYKHFLGYITSDQTKRPCVPKSSGNFDYIFTDYYGLKYLKKKSMGTFAYVRCKLLLLDSFGTEAQFNYNGAMPRFAWPSQTGFIKTSFGNNNLKLKQFMTMFPHSPDNSFLGFVVNNEATKLTVKKKQRALVYGKHFYMWKDLKSHRFLDLIHEHFEIHATVGGASDLELKKYLPSYVINHGILAADKFREFLSETKLFIGLGFPYEGPAALEAISQGCIFLNPKFVPARNQINTKFFKGKPTFRSLTSQHPYTEHFIGEPRVFTVDIMNENAMNESIKKILETEVDPYLPFEFTHEGMLERVNAFLKYHDFCEPGREDWPPLSSRKVYAASNSKSCKDVCLEKGLVCEPSYFKSVDIPRYFESFPCDVKKIVKRPSLVAPAYITDEKICVTQSVANLYSCTASDRFVQRICPCRDYRPGQVALCSSCF